MITGSFTSKVGEIEVKIIDGGASVDAEITDIGNLVYEYDLLPDGPEVDAVQVLYNKISISISQYSHTKVDLYDRLLANVVSEQGVKVELVADGDTFPFFIQLQDIELSEVERVITLDCRVLYDESVTVLEVFDAIEADAPALLKTYVQDLSDAEELECVGVLDWIKYALNKLFLNDYDNIAHSVDTGLPPAFTPKNYVSFASALPANQIAFTMIRMTDPPFGGIDVDAEWVRAEVPVVKFNSSTQVFEILETPVDYDLQKALRVGDNVRFYPGTLFPPTWNERVVSEIVSSTQFKVSGSVSSSWNPNQLWEIKKKTSTADLLATQALQELAAIEGSIFGTGFGKNFYLNRLVDQDVASIDWQEVQDFDVSIFQNPIGISITQLAKIINDFDVNLSSGNFPEVFNQGIANYGVWPAVSPWTTPDRALPVIVDATAVVSEKPGITSQLRLNVAPGYPFLSSVMYDATATKFYGTYTYDSFKWYQNTLPTVALCRSGLMSYMRSLNTEEIGIIIEFTLLGAKSIMPWNLVEFTGAGLPTKYSTKKFRPTKLEYDLVNDTVKVKAYQIFEADVPEPNEEEPGIPVNLDACKDTLQSPVDIRIAWNPGLYASSYELQRSTTSAIAGFATIATTTDTFYHDDTPSGTTQYWYRVRSVNAYGESDWTLAIEVIFDTTDTC